MLVDILMSIQWRENEFPKTLRDMLLDSDYDNIDIDMGIDEESEDDDE